ncbi:MAG: UDP-3-O-acyl-N-acetylglucosamine deacetylase, partial [Leptospiraceae bacterium]|nr:UDP-3-O-acyl-N-acetylglucosamine deacetylase [Leptospiraceae bacterium]
RGPVLPVPDHFQVNWPWDANSIWTVRKPVEVHSVSTFENAPVTVSFRPQKGRRPLFYLNGKGRSLRPRNLIHGTNNIQLGAIKIIEHPIAMMLALRLDVDVAIDQPSFPSLDHCTGEYLDALHGHVRRTRRAVRNFTVDKPILLKYEQGYCIVEPHESGLFMDHEFEYPGAIGYQRISVEITPQFFLFLGRARTPSFRSVEETDQIIAAARAGQLPYPMHEENVLFADVNGLRNPREIFDYNGHNYEFILHELIDVMAFLKLVESELGGRFRGKLTTRKFGHGDQILAARTMVSPEFLEDPGYRWLD